MSNDNAKQDNIVSINEGLVKDHLGEIVRSTVEDTLNQVLDAEADRLKRKGTIYNSFRTTL